MAKTNVRKYVFFITPPVVLIEATGAYPFLPVLLKTSVSVLADYIQIIADRHENSVPCSLKSLLFSTFVNFCDFVMRLICIWMCVTNHGYNSLYYVHIGSYFNSSLFLCEYNFFFVFVETKTFQNASTTFVCTINVLDLFSCAEPAQQHAFGVSINHTTALLVVMCFHRQQGRTT